MRQRILMLAAVCSLLGCYEPADYVYGRKLDAQQLQLHGANTGIHPDQSVMEDPANPFRDSIPSEKTKWVLQEKAGHVAGFYAWATVLSQAPGGEAQFYVATNLRAIYENGEAPQEQLPVVKEQAIRAFQAVLDSFPESVTYDATGTVAYPLSTPAYKGITELGGKVSGGWVLVRTADGAERAVKP